jgi:Protein of unknown function (DUF1153)
MCKAQNATIAFVGAKSVLGPYGAPLCITDLPQPGTRRWVIRRKAEIVAAVRGGLVSLEDACSRYALTAEEFLADVRILPATFEPHACGEKPIAIVDLEIGFVLQDLRSALLSCPAFETMSVLKLAGPTVNAGYVHA